MCTIYGTRGGKQTQSGPRKKISAFFYRTEAGGEPVREWLKTLTKEEKKVIGEDIKTCELGWPIGMPVARALGDGLHEVRTSCLETASPALFFMSIRSSEWFFSMGS